MYSMSANATPLFLSVGSEGAAKRYTLADGTPVAEFRHDAIQIGQTYTRKGWATPLVVTEDRASHWLTTFDAMQKNGVAMVVTKDHHEKKTADVVMGDMIGLERHGEWLQTVHQVRGQKNIEIAEACRRVSIEIEPKVTDGKGKEYQDCIYATAYVPRPVVSGQRIAAGLEDPADNEYHLSLEKPMAFDTAKHFEAIERLRKLPKGSVTEENATDHILDHCARYMGLETEAAAAKEKLTMALAEVDTLKKTAPRQATADKKFLSLAARVGEERLDRSPKLSQATKDALKSELIGDRKEGKFSALMLSMEDPEGIADTVDRVVKIIESNNPVATGEATAKQLGLEVVPAKANDADPVKPEVKKENPWLAK